MKIALVGLMGCGKTAVAKELGELLPSYKVFFSDGELEEAAKGKPITEIFKAVSSDFFRYGEIGIIYETVFKNNDNIILDLGGGAFVRDCTREILNKNGVITVFLDTPIDLIYDRLEKEYAARPLLNCKDWKAELKKIFEERRKYYEEANIMINTQEYDGNIKELAKKILSLCEERYKGTVQTIYLPVKTTITKSECASFDEYGYNIGNSTNSVNSEKIFTDPEKKILPKSYLESIGAVHNPDIQKNAIKKTVERSVEISWVEMLSPQERMSDFSHIQIRNLEKYYADKLAKIKKEFDESRCSSM